MSIGEVKKYLIALPNGDYLITEEHTHSDILRFVVNDIGLEETKYLLDDL